MKPLQNITFIVVFFLNTDGLEDIPAWLDLSGTVTRTGCDHTHPSWHKEHMTCWALGSTGQA